MKRITLLISMTLQSDAIFGSGLSIPGGADIAVMQDDSGFPYLPGSSLKGLLSESVQNWLCWADGCADTHEALFGLEGWNGLSSDRRIQLTDLRLSQPPEDAQLCYRSRCFTALENGVVQDGTLRQAQCIRSGLQFTGTLSCAEADAALICNALSCIKWVGASRNRGLGRVHMQAQQMPEAPSRRIAPTGCCIAYRLHTELPLIITDACRSQGYQYETQPLIPGSAVRGAVLSILATEQAPWFHAHKQALLQSVRFLDALPVIGNQAVLPAIKGFYEDKSEEHFTSVVTDGQFKAGNKRAKIGSFCSIDGYTLKYWSPATGGVTRIQRPTQPDTDPHPFQVRYLKEGQDFDGYILLDDPTLTSHLVQALPPELWLGADRYAGFGKCSVTFRPDLTEPLWRRLWGYREKAPEADLYLLAVSPFTMLNALGEPCGIDWEALARKLGVSTVELRFCSTSVGEYGGYNRTLQSGESVIRMYDRGSLFHIRCDRAPEQSRLEALQNEGLGIRRNQGYGQILFLRRELLEGIHEKEAALPTVESTSMGAVAQLRQAKERWMMQTASVLHDCALSPSQLGAIQEQVRKAIADNGNTEGLKLYFASVQSRGPKTAQTHQAIRSLLEQILSVPVSQTLGCPAADSLTLRLQLVDSLINFSRKGVR